MNEALEAQKEVPKKILMDVYTSWCGPCKLLDKNTFGNKDVIKYVNKNYYPVKFNAEGTESVTYQDFTYTNPNYQEGRKGRNSQHLLAHALKITGYPTIVFFKENGDLFWTKSLNETTDIPKDSGLFTTQGHRLYRIVIPDFTSNEKRLDWSYKILLKTDSNSPSFASAETPMVKEFRIKRPNFQGTQRFSFTSSKGAEIQFYQAVNARIYQGYVDFLYMEMPEGSQMDSTRHSVRYNLPYTIGSSLNGGSYLSNSLSYEAYYTFLSEKIPQAPGHIRFFRGFNVHLSAGSDDLATYISVSQPSNTILQDPPFYSNVENGAGIFASRVSLERPNIGLTSASLDSLIFGKLTCPLRFAKASFLDTLTCN